MVPSFCQKAFWCVTYRLSGTLDRLRKLDMVQHCKWSRADGLGGKGCTRMPVRPPVNLKLHLPGFGHAFRVTGFMPLFVIWKAVLQCATPIYSRVARFKPVRVDTLEVA